jgi:hypothetical protein
MTTQQLLRITPDEHENIIISNYMTWCKSYSKGKDEIMQRLLSAPNLFNWWYQEYQELEARFENDVRPYIGIMSHGEITDMYRNEMKQMHNFYCRPLIYTARYKHQNITNVTN